MKTTAMFLRSLTGRGGTVDPDNPWPGLLPFSEADQEFFHGRRQETGELARLVARTRMCVLFGLSGLGKSSLLQAGLFPRLRGENVLPVYIRLDFSAERADLVSQVRDAIDLHAEAAAVDAPQAREGDTLWEYFHRREADFWSTRNRPVLPLLVFDQFEEIFTLGRADARRAAASAALIDELGDLAQGRPPAALKARLDERPAEAEAFAFGRHPYKILLALREDFLPDLESLRPRFGPELLNRLRLRRMDGAAALEVVGEARRLIDLGVAEQVVRFVAKAESADVHLRDLEVDPALLSVVCRELNNQRRKQGKEKITGELLEGSRAEILSDFYERSLADIGQEVRTFVEDELLVEGYRDSVALEKALNVPGVTREVVDQLVERRLVRIDPRDGLERLELTHDLLTGVIAASRDRRRLREAAAHEAAKRDRELRELQERERQVRREAARREREARLRLRGALAVLAVVLAAALFAGWQAVALRESKRALEASKAELETVQHQLQEANARADEALEELEESLRRSEKESELQDEIERQLRALLAAEAQERDGIEARLQTVEKAHETAEDDLQLSRGAVRRKIEAYSDAKNKLPQHVQRSLEQPTPSRVAGPVDVVLTSYGEQKIAVIKAVREVTGLGLKEAKDLVESAPAPVRKGVPPEEARKIKKTLEEAGARVEVEPASSGRPSR